MRTQRQRSALIAIVRGFDVGAVVRGCEASCAFALAFVELPPTLELAKLYIHSATSLLACSHVCQIMADSTDDESMIMPIVMMGVIVLFALYACCGPAADPNKEKTHSMGSSTLAPRPFSHSLPRRHAAAAAATAAAAAAAAICFCFCFRLVAAAAAVSEVDFDERMLRIRTRAAREMLEKDD